MISEQDILNDQLAGAESSRSSELSLPSTATEVRHLTPLWRNHDFLLLWSGQLLSSVGSEVSLLAFPLLVLAMTHSAVLVGLIGALRSLPFALLCRPAGALIDRWDRKRVMLICDTGRALALSSIPVALWLGRLGLLQLCLVALVEGTLMTFFDVAEIACLPHVVPKEQIPAASARKIRPSTQPPGRWDRFWAAFSTVWGTRSRS
jgi:MFS family permease